MDKFLTFYMFFGAFFLITIGFGHLVEKNRDFIKNIHALSFVGQGLVIMLVSLYSTSIMPELYWLVLLLIPFTFLVTPLMIMRYSWLFSAEYKLQKKYFYFFIPSFITFIFCIVPLLPGIHIQYTSIGKAPVLSNEFSLLPVYSKIIFSLIIASKAIFFSLIVFMLLKLFFLWRKNLNVTITPVIKIGYFFALAMAITTGISFLGDIFSIKLVRISMIMANTFIIAVYIVSQRKPGYNRMLRIVIQKVKYEQSYITNIDAESVQKQLTELMDEEKAFADEDMSLNKLASELAITPHQLSQILNERLKKNFHTFINEYRIEEAKKLLVEDSDRSILSVSIAVGYNSYTTFCTAFSKQTGLSPSKYRKKFPGQ